MGISDPHAFIRNTLVLRYLGIKKINVGKIDLSIFLTLVGKMAKNKPSIKSNNPKAVKRSFIFKFKVF